MSRPLWFLLVGIFLAEGPCLAAPSGRAGATPALRQIDALLKNQLRPEPLPVDPPNPFAVAAIRMRESRPESSATRVPGTPPIADPGATSLADREAVVLTDADVLAACAARLHFGGVMRHQGELQLLINNIARKQGDFIAMEGSGSSVYLRIERLTPGQITLRLADAAVTLNYSFPARADPSK